MSTWMMMVLMYLVFGLYLAELSMWVLKKKLPEQDREKSHFVVGVVYLFCFFLWPLFIWLFVLRRRSR